MVTKKVFLFISGAVFLIIGVWQVGPLYESFYKQSVKGESVMIAEYKDKRLETEKVERVVDGDTIILSSGKTVRYIGINSPETKDPHRPIQCFGREAYEENKNLLEGKMIRLEKDVSEKDKFGRLLRYVYLDELFVNDYLVRQGYAFSTSYPPDIKHQEQFRQAEEEARQNNRGLWGGC